jgi:hypothetical protein
MQSGLHGLEVERTVRYDVHRLNIPNWQSIVGQSLEEALHLKQGQRAILGYHNGEEVFANGAKNYIENVHEMGNGVLSIEVRETLGLGTGTKIDAGIKGLVSGVSRKEIRPGASPPGIHNFPRARERLRLPAIPPQPDVSELDTCPARRLPNPDAAPPPDACPAG